MIQQFKLPNGNVSLRHAWHYMGKCTCDMVLSDCAVHAVYRALLISAAGAFVSDLAFGTQHALLAFHIQQVLLKQYGCTTCVRSFAL